MSRSTWLGPRQRRGALAGLLLFLSWDAAAATEAIWLVSEPWPAPFSLEELAEALRLRLRGFALRIVPEAPQGTSGPIVALVDGSPVRIRLVRRDRVLLDAPVPEPREGGARRAALVTLIALETAADEPVEILAGDTAVAAPERNHWALSAAVGTALALDDDSAGIAPVLLVRARAFFSDHASIDLGVKLSGAYEGRSPSHTISIVDRSVWLGAAAHVSWGSLAAALGLAAQYTHPSVDADGPELEGVDPSLASRFGVRASVDLVWSVHRNLALVLGAAVTFGFAEREFNAGGQELLELGSAGLDVAIGPEVRW
jgi:hypothetical protein